MGIVQHPDSGTRRIRQECRDYGGAEPVIEVFENCVTTTYRRSFVQAERGARGKGHVTVLRNYSSATISEFLSYTG